MLFLDSFPNGVYVMLCLSRRTGFVHGVLLVAFSLLPATPVQATDANKASIAMTVGEMCGGCVKRITK